MVAPLVDGKAKNNSPMETQALKSPKVIFFDVNETLLDLQPLKESVANVLNGRKELVPLWFTTLLQYSLVATVGDHFVKFGEIGAATLQMVAQQNNISLSADKAKEALKPIRSLPPHKEVPEALSRLKDAGYTLVPLTNSDTEALNDQMQNSGLKKYFDRLLSVEETGIYKPHTRVYNWATRKMGVQPGESMMIAAHGWDIAGAKWAGWQAAFVDRPGQQLYPLAEKPELNLPDLTQIADRLVAVKKG